MPTQYFDPLTGQPVSTPAPPQYFNPVTGEPVSLGAPSKKEGSGLGSLATGLGISALGVPAVMKGAERVGEQVATSPFLSRLANPGESALLKELSAAHPVAGKFADIFAKRAVPAANFGKQAFDVMSGQQSITDAGKDAARNYALTKLPGLIQKGAARTLPALGTSAALTAGGGLAGAAGSLAFLQGIENDTKRDFSGVKNETGLRGNIFDALTKPAPKPSVSTSEEFRLPPSPDAAWARATSIGAAPQQSYGDMMRDAIANLFGLR